MTRRLRVATRGSPLARKQAALVIDLLGGAADPEPVVVDTLGDRHTDAPIWELGGQGVFVKEVQAAVLDGRADVAVHSAKDLPSSTVEGLVIGAVPERDDPRDALVGCALADLPPGARIGTGSVRRRAQLAWLRPDLTFGSLRGNMETRLAKASSFDAVVVAAAALRRLGRSGDAADLLPASLVVPQVGQGALAVECRADDGEAREALASIDHRVSHLAVAAERAFLAEVGGGCDVPVGAHAVVAADGQSRTLTLTLTGLLARADGGIVLRHTGEAEVGVDGTGWAAGEAVGRAVARHLLGNGGQAVLADLPADRAGV